MVKYIFYRVKNDLARKYQINKSDTDTEVLLYGLIYEGINFLPKCNGMWAFCLWDRHTKSALLAEIDSESNLCIIALIKTLMPSLLK